MGSCACILTGTRSGAIRALKESLPHSRRITELLLPHIETEASQPKKLPITTYVSLFSAHAKRAPNACTTASSSRSGACFSVRARSDREVRLCIDFHHCCRRQSQNKRRRERSCTRASRFEGNALQGTAVNCAQNVARASK